jgi:hypothetical protein
MSVTPLARSLWLSAAAALAFASLADAQETVRITIPSSVTFNVSDVSRSTTGDPAPTVASYTDAQLVALHRLRVSVKADAVSFTAPGGAAIPASNLSWTTSAAQGGTASSGTVSASAYRLLYESNLLPMSGSVDVTWTLAAPGPGIRAGVHSLTLRWKVESIFP